MTFVSWKERFVGFFSKLRARTRGRLGSHRHRRKTRQPRVTHARYNKREFAWRKVKCNDSRSLPIQRAHQQQRSQRTCDIKTAEKICIREWMEDIYDDYLDTSFKEIWTVKRYSVSALRAVSQCQRSPENLGGSLYCLRSEIQGTGGTLRSRILLSSY